MIVKRSLALILCVLLALTGRAHALTEVPDFGQNPGNLAMYKHVPSAMPPGAPLVVVAHGCDQTAASFDRDAGWSDLAEAMKFYTVYPETNPRNNPMSCFNWFLPGDYRRDQGEALSIKSMIDRMKEDHSIDEQRIFVVGLSAGGGMTANLLISYPELFAGGAVMSGLPGYCSRGYMDGVLGCFMSLRDLTPQAWGELARAANPGFAGPWPVMSIYYGTADEVMPQKDRYLVEIMEQWTDIHGTGQVPAWEDEVEGFPHKVYHDDEGRPVVETYGITGMRHGVAVSPCDAPPCDPDRGGDAAGAYSYDRGLWSTYYAATFWGITDVDVVPPRVAIIHPEDGAEVEGAVLITAMAFDESGVDRMVLLIDDGEVESASGGDVYHVWDTTQAYEGGHRITARAYDPSLNEGTHEIMVYGGTAVDSTPPTVDITSPAHGATVGGIVAIAASAADVETGVNRIEFFVRDEPSPRCVDPDSPYECEVDAGGYPDGTELDLKATAYDGAGNPATDDDTTVTVDHGAGCEEWYATNMAHVVEGRAYTAWFTFTFARGSGDYLGLLWVASSWVRSDDGEYFEKGPCP